MRNVKLAVIAIALAAVAGARPASAQRGPTTPAPTTTPTPRTPPHPPPVGMEIKATTPEQVLREVEQMFGFVPQMIRMVPDHLLVGFWSGLKGLEMNPDTNLDAKTKELIGLAVAAQIPCEYCVYFHTNAAKQNGATDQEIKEAIGMAAITRMGSTILNGSQLDRTAFRKDADRMFRRETGRGQARPSPAPRR